MLRGRGTFPIFQDERKQQVCLQSAFEANLHLLT